jgi:hypothetical protein
LFVASWYGTISEYDANTGALVKANFITGLVPGAASGVAISVPETSSCAVFTGIAAFGLATFCRRKKILEGQSGMARR